MNTHMNNFFWHRRNGIKIRLNKDDYRDRVYACWQGKNIGGTMGTPYENKREILDVKGFVTEAGKPLPNDDLDLQLIWLHAVEWMGARAINASALGEFWSSFITPNWNEYGICKANIRMGIAPSLSGDFENSWKNSNGAWIRTEIWACLFPGCPDIAARFATEDAKVDHGSGEGTAAAAYVAAMQSAAFVTHDTRKCVEMALHAIPETTRMADSVRFILDCYDKKIDYIDARNAIQQRNADIGDGWFEAPSNVAYAIIGLLWGEGDFKKSMIYAINCGDDTDCTAATVGATLGLMGGTAIIPKDWSAHIGDEIITVSVERGDGMTGQSVPKSCSELTERVVAQAPHTLFETYAPVEIVCGESEIPEDAFAVLTEKCDKFREEERLVPYSFMVHSSLFHARAVICDEKLTISPNEEKKIDIHVYVERAFGHQLYNINCRWWLPEGFEVQGTHSATILNNTAHSEPTVKLSYTVKAGDIVAPSNRCVLEIVPVGRHTPLYVPITFVG